MSTLTRPIASALALALVCGLATSEAVSQTTGSVGAIARGASGLPLPRFVSLKANRVNMRIGPGRNYSVDWMYLKAGLPMEIVQEYDNWRRVRDAEGAEGWINQALLSGERTAVVTPWQRGKDVRIALRREPDANAATAALLEPGVIGAVRECDGEWCEMVFDGNRGWLEQAQLWGVYPGEKVED